MYVMLCKQVILPYIVSYAINFVVVNLAGCDCILFFHFCFFFPFVFCCRRHCCRVIANKKLLKKFPLIIPLCNI